MFAESPSVGNSAFFVWRCVMERVERVERVEVVRGY